MKTKTLLSLALLSLTGTPALQAQITITSAATFPPAGVQDSAYIATGTLPGAGGNGVTWDFSSLTLSYGALTKMMAPASTPYSSSFPSATHAVELNITGMPGPVYDYYELTSEGYYIIASTYSSASPNDNYTPNTKLRIPFPLAYGSTVVDTFQKVGYPLNSYAITYDGFGTLKVPGATYDQVARIKYQWADGEIAYNWLDPASLLPLATWSENNGGTLMVRGGTVPTQVPALSVNGFQILPNPARTDVQLTLSDRCEAPANCLLWDMSGRLLQSVPVRDGRAVVSRQNLPAGVYILEVHTADRSLGRARLVFE